MADQDVGMRMVGREQGIVKATGWFPTGECPTGEEEVEGQTTGHGRLEHWQGGDGERDDEMTDRMANCARRRR